MSKRLPWAVLISSALILTSCTGGAPRTGAPRLIPPAWLTEAPPEEIPQPPENPTEEQLVENHIEAAGMYHTLRIRFLGLVQWIEETDRKLRERINHELR